MDEAKGKLKNKEISEDEEKSIRRKNTKRNRFICSKNR